MGDSARGITISNSKIELNENRPPLLNKPISVVQKILNDTTKIADYLTKIQQDIQHRKQELRSQLLNNQVIDDDSEIKNHSYYKSCGIDGSLVMNRYVGTDLIFAAAVRAEGILSSTDSQSKEEDNDSFVSAEMHDDENNGIIGRALMLEMELKLAAKAPHELVLIDGSLTTALIHMYKAVHYFRDGFKQSILKLKNDFGDFLIAYKKILAGENSEKIWVGLPKYTSRRDIAHKLNWKMPYDDKAVLSLVLAPGEFTRPIVFTDRDAWHDKVPYVDEKTRNLTHQIITEIKQLSFVYYKPHRWMPALRLEVPYKIARSYEKLSQVLETVKSECKAPAIMEPYPLYMADRKAKKISQAIHSYRQILTTKMIRGGDINASDLLLMMRSYRTEEDRI